MAQINRLSPLKIKGALDAGWHADGGNLFLRVRDSGSRSWFFRYKRKVEGKAADKVTEIGLGTPTDRDLKEVRRIAGLMRTALANGDNPADVLKAKDARPPLTFKESAEELIAAKKLGFRNAKHIQQWSNTLATYAYPLIGEKTAEAITLADVKDILSPLWATKTETATRLRQRIEAVLDYAAVHEESDRRNPARWRGNLDKVFQAPRKVTKPQHHAAAPYAMVPKLMAALKRKDSTSAFCLRFTILTAARSGEARGACWSEIDEAGECWTIPASRMKAGREHKVPLSAEALAILKKMKPRKIAGSDFIFAGPTGGLLSDVAVNKTLHADMPDVTVHGFRSSFRDWGAETTAYPSAVLEAALAHTNNNKVEAAYQRSDLFQRRKELMASWAGYIAGNNNVIRLSGVNRANG